jgi:hypothetical protein
MFYGYLVDFIAFWYILWIFGTFLDYLVYFSRFGKLYQKNLATLVHFIRKACLVVKERG